MELDALLAHLKAETADRSRAENMDLDSHEHNIFIERAEENIFKFVKGATTVKINRRIRSIPKMHPSQTKPRK